MLSMPLRWRIWDRSKPAGHCRQSPLEFVVLPLPLSIRVPQAMQMRLFVHCVTKARQKARHQLVVGRRLRCYLIIACHASRFVLAHAAQDYSPLVGHQTAQLCPSYPSCIINMSGYDFRKGQGIILCSLGAEIAAAADFPLFLFRPIGTLSWLRTGGSRRRGTTTMDLGP